MVDVKQVENSNSSRLNIVLAFIGICIAFTYFLPNQSVNRVLQSAFGENPFNITVNRLILIIVALVSLTGSVWFFSRNWGSDGKVFSVVTLLPHLLIPVFTSVTLAYALSQLIRTPWWWLVYLLGLVLLAVVLVAEDHDLNNYEKTSPIPMISLCSLSMGLYLLGLIVLRTIGPRLYVLVPIVGLATAFVSLRFVELRTDRKTSWEIIVAIVLILSQLSAALYYLFINALQFALIMTGVLYCLTTLAIGLQMKKTGSGLIVEPISMLIITATLTGLTILF
ncbi:MAG: hypothetical protein WBI14_03755 [Anaerolineaceae bacterium]